MSGSLLQSQTTFNFIELLQYTPFFWAWVLSVFVWFFLEIAVWAAHYFNTKHSYVGGYNRATVFMLSLPKLVHNNNKNALLKALYAMVI